MLNNPASPQISPAQVRVELRRILASDLFRDSHTLSGLLTFLVEETLAGRGAGLKESVVAVEVFERTDFDPRFDSIVRVQASALRRKLAAFYADQPAPACRIDLPRGGYIPTWQGMSTAPARKIWAWRPIAAIAALAAVLIVTVAAAQSYRRSRVPEAGFLADFLANGRPTHLIYGVPQFFSISGMLVRDLTVNARDQILPSSPVTRVYQLWEHKQMDALPRPTRNVYTGIGEANSLPHLMRFFWERGGNLEFAPDSHADRNALAGANLIVVASLRFQTMRDLKIPAGFQYEAIRGSFEGIRNLAPQPGEQADYRRWEKGNKAIDYAVISLWRGVHSDSRLLLLGGTSTWATQAAVQYVTSQSGLAELSAKLRSRERQSPFFQALLRVRLQDDRPLAVETVAIHDLASTVQIAQR